MKSLFRRFSELSSKNIENDGYSPVEKISYSDLFYIGVSDKKTPMVLIDCNIDNSPADIELKYIEVLYNKHCKIIDNEEKSEITCTILKLNNESYDFQSYFLEVIDLILQRLQKNPTSTQINDEIIKIIKLFSCTTHPALKSVQGLWAEILVIEQSKDPDSLIKAWHSKTTSKFDFNNGEDKIEVKSTTNNSRIHTFSLEQLFANENSQLIIASVITVQTGLGKNILDLRDSIFSRVMDIDTQVLFDSIIFATLGNEIDKCNDFIFDYQLAVDELRFYNSLDVPKINKELIPSEISNVKFQSNLTHIKDINRKDTFMNNNPLFSKL